jgi:hypothetical protein
MLFGNDKEMQQASEEDKKSPSPYLADSRRENLSNQSQSAMQI